MAIKPKKNYTKFIAVVAVIIIAEIMFLTSRYLDGKNVFVLSPAGTIAEQQKNLILFAAGLSLLVIVPVFVLLFFILWRFRDGNVKAKYRPNWDGNKQLETIWWGLPIAIILVLATVTWKTTHSLDPYRALSSKTKPMTVQVVALQWKWLFIYPDQNIATVNYLQIPEDTPINFEITSDAPMNSFWIPQLGGQVYAMSGMQTQLHLMADHPGTYRGVSANISGEGFAGMKFDTVASSSTDFASWVQTVQQSPKNLSATEYAALALPSKNNEVLLFGSRSTDLYDTVIMKYMHSHTTEHATSAADDSMMNMDMSGGHH